MVSQMDYHSSLPRSERTTSRLLMNGKLEMIAQNFSRLIVFLAALCSAVTTFADGAGDVTLRTDHPHYPGEGVFQSVDDCIRFATDGKAGDQEKAIALYLWMLTHQWHLASPQEWNVPGETPDTNIWRDDMVVYDANRARFSYGYGLCGTVHSWNEPYWKALGMQVRRREFPGHVNSEVRYGGRWHAFDTDMAGIVFGKDGAVAGYDDIIADPSLVEQTHAPLPCYPFAWPSDLKSMRKGWEEIARGGNWHKMYNSGYVAHPAIVQVRRGETFTRWFDPDHYGGKDKRRFWHHQDNGPFRNWTFANQGTPEHRGAEANCRGNARYCNGEFVYQPDLTSVAYRDGVVDQSANVVPSMDQPKLRSQDGKPAIVTFEHFSPYVICGDPVDDANPMSGTATDGLIVEGSAVGNVSVEISVDQGQTWHRLNSVTGNFSHDLTEHVKGRYGWQLRFGFQDKAGLDALKFTTTTQVCQAIYPRLTDGGCRVAYRCAMRGVTPMLPNFGSDEATLRAVEQRDMRSDNVVYEPRSSQSRLAYRTTNNRPGHVVFRVNAGERELLEVYAAVRYGVRVPPPDNCDYRIEISTDDGESWRPLARADIPADNEFSSGWMYGKADVAESDTNEVLVRIQLYQGGYQAGMIDAQFYGVYRSAPPPSAIVTYGWKEAGELKRHTERIPTAAREHVFEVPTGKIDVDEFVRIQVP